MSHIIATAEAAASLMYGDRRSLILPYSLENERLLMSRDILVREPYLSRRRTVYAADYVTSYGWKAAQDMPDDCCRMMVLVQVIKLVYDKDLSVQDFLDDGVYPDSGVYRWQRTAPLPVDFKDPQDAWLCSQKAFWGRHGRGTKSLLARIAVNHIDRAVA